MQNLLLLILIPALATLASAHAVSADLDSAQQRLYNDAQYYLNELERALKPLELKSRGVADKSAPLDTIALQKALNEAKNAGLKLGNAHSRLVQLPQQESSVVSLSNRAAELAQRLLTCHETFTAAQAAKEAATAGAVDLPADVKRMEAVSVRVANDRTLESDPAVALRTVRELDRMVAFKEEMEAKYAAILGDPAGRAMKDTITGFEHRLGTYRAAMERIAQTLPETIRRDIDTARELADTAVSRKSASAFQNGAIEGAFARAQVNVELLEAIAGESAATAALAKQKREAEARIAAAHQALESEILAANTPPRDVYAGADEAELLALVEEAWAKSPVKGEVLAMRIPMRAWERSEGIRWAHDRFEVHDFSELQVAVCVRADAETVHVYPALLEKDHLKGDTIRVRLDDRGEVPLHRRILVENWE